MVLRDHARGMPVGVLTERDIIRPSYARGLNPDRIKVGSVMSSPVTTIEPEGDLRQTMT